MRGVILGSGIIGLMAKKLLQGDWTIIPFSRSRYYTFNPPLADNFIIRDDEIDRPMKDLTGSSDVFFYKRCYSDRGELISQHDDAVAKRWLDKVFGDPADVPGQALPYFSRRLVSPIYSTRVNVLYRNMLSEMMPVLKDEADKGAVTEVGANYLIRGGARIEFDHMVSTIPLPTLLKLMGKEAPLAARDEHFILLKSDSIDLEGYNQSLVTDGLIDFYKVTILAPRLFMLYFINEVPLPGKYLLPIIGNADIVDGTKIPDSIPIGQMPDITWLENMGIYCIGSHAQWDWCADVGSNLLRLVRYAARGYQPAG